jgi:leader peptidase (prepilin peptidase)/N-methyltransferase
MLDLIAHGWVGLLLSVSLGLAFGSFSNVAIYRIPIRGLSVSRPRWSFCTSCHTTLGLSDNIPVISWLLLGGRCRHCGSPVAWRYPAMELVVMALFVVFWWRMPPETGVGMARLSVAWVLCFYCVVVSAIDLELTIIPDVITLPGVALGLAVAVALPELHHPHMGFDPASPRTSALIAAGAGALAGGGSLWLVGRAGNILFARRIESAGMADAMGLGDVKWMAATGTVLGVEGVMLAILAACFVGALVGVVLKLVARARGAADVAAIPFGPYLSAGVLLELGWPGTVWTTLQGFGPTP